LKVFAEILLKSQRGDQRKHFWIYSKKFPLVSPLSFSLKFLEKPGVNFSRRATPLTSPSGHPWLSLLSLLLFYKIMRKLSQRHRSSVKPTSNQYMIASLLRPYQSWCNKWLYAKAKKIKFKSQDIFNTYTVVIFYKKKYFVI
jgi:hypothetical protein